MRAPWWLSGAAALSRRPGLWPVAIAQAASLAGPGWWRRLPPLPRPDERWLAFRMETAYGEASRRPSGKELIEFLEWVKATRTASGGGRNHRRGRQML